MIRLFYSPRSPYVRKVMIVAHELGLAEQVEFIDCAAHPIDRDASIVKHNPLGQVPTALLDDGTMLADSGVICQYLDAMKPSSMFPVSGPARWRALTDEAVADGVLEALLLARYEMVVRPSEKLWPEWRDGQFDKMNKSLDAFERAAGDLGKRFDIGTIAIACALGFIDQVPCFIDIDWRTSRPALSAWYAAETAKRPSFQITRAERPAA